MLEKFQGKMAGSTLLVPQMSAITSLWHFLECLSAAFIVANVKVIKGQQSKKLKFSPHSLESHSTCETWRVCSRMFQTRPMEKQQKREETGEDTWRGQKRLQSVHLCSRWDLQQNRSHSSLWLLWFIKAPSILRWGCCKRPHQFGIKSSPASDERLTVNLLSHL